MGRLREDHEADGHVLRRTEGYGRSVRPEDPFVSGPGELEYDENGRLLIRGEDPPKGFESLWDDDDEQLDDRENTDAR